MRLLGRWFHAGGFDLEDADNEAVVFLFFHFQRALHDDLQRVLSDDEMERRRLSKALLPHVKAFYAGYFDPAVLTDALRSDGRNALENVEAACRQSGVACANELVETAPLNDDIALTVHGRLPGGAQCCLNDALRQSGALPLAQAFAPILPSVPFSRRLILARCMNHSIAERMANRAAKGKYCDHSSIIGTTALATSAERDE